MSKWFLPTAAGIFAMTAMLAGCGGDDDNNNLPPPTHTTGPATATVAPRTGTPTVAPPTGTPTVVATEAPTELPTPTATVSSGFENADGINGGQLYDTFWASETGFDQNDPNIAIFAASSDFFRCKQCHAWDRLGNAASYINRAPRTNRPNVSDIDLAELSRTASPGALFDLIAGPASATRRDVDADLSTYNPANPETTVVGDQMPDYSQILTDAQIWDLVKYLKEEAFDTTELYEIMTEGSYPTGSRTFSDWGRDGNAENGDALYTSKCAGCHSNNGVGGPFPIAGGEATVGSFLRSSPHETWHKVKFGQIGSVMGPQGIDDLTEMKDLYSALANVTKYPDPAP